MVVLTNKESYPIAGGSSAPNTMFWALMPDGKKRHITIWAEVVGWVDGGVKIAPMTTGNIQSLPDWVAPVTSIPLPAPTVLSLTQNDVNNVASATRQMFTDLPLTIAGSSY